MTVTAAPRRRRGQVAAPETERHAASPDERRLVLGLCGTQDRRRRDESQTRTRGSADADRLGELLGHLRLTGLVGRRLLELGAAIDPRLEAEIHGWTACARQLGRTHELTTLAVLEELEREGIRALALKGSVLAREIYGDVGVRSCG